MESLGTLQEASRKVLRDTRRCLAVVRSISSQRVANAEQGVAVLRRLRHEVYEDLNQIQHEHLVIQAAQWLVENNQCPASTQWRWNPRQTGTANEPDLEGRIGTRVIVSAEITTSERPIGIIDTRMAKVLQKLAAGLGRRYYFVCSEPMFKRAETKVTRAGWSITVVRLPSDIHAS